MKRLTGGRTARADDYDAIVRAVDNWWGRPVTASLPRLFLDHFWSTSRVVENEQGLAAFLVAFISPSQPHLAYLHFVGVRPDRRRGRLAQGLYEDFADYALERGCTELRAITAPGNDVSIRFHQRIGFTVSQTAEDYNGPGRPMITFRRALPPTDKQPAT